jgi:methylenetetrahydrofolate dehydrogenase (NADP+)/methenyltetrahydrofolate cyclohydrolase
MISLNGRELAGYIKERQAKQVRRLRQSYNVSPKLAIIATVDNPAINTYLRLKKAYGADILVEVDIYRIEQEAIGELLNKLSRDNSVHGIIVQLPLADPSQTDQIVNLVPPEKDVDGLSTNSLFEPATPIAILWLLSGYNLDLNGKQVLLVGAGKLVGGPLRAMLTKAGITPQVADRSTTNLKDETLKADVLITATGSAGLIKSDMIKDSAIVIDAGVAGEQAETRGDVDPSVYSDRSDLTITPIKGGVGPLTVCALFENVIWAADRAAKK